MLQMNNRVQHNINDIEFSEWIIANLTEAEFKDERSRGTGGFGCLCDQLEPQAEDSTPRHYDENFYRLHLSWVNDFQSNRDQELNEWFLRLLPGFDPEASDAENMGVDVYYCSKCHQWAIDERL